MLTSDDLNPDYEKRIVAEVDAMPYTASPNSTVPQKVANMRLTELSPGTKVPRVDLPEGEELFVLRGAFSDEHGRYDRHTWRRMPAGSHHSPASDTGCLLYVKSGGFPR